MPKKLQDVIKIKVVKEGPTPLGLRRIKVEEPKDVDVEVTPKEEPPYRQIIDKEHSGRSGFGLWVVATVSLVFLFFAFSVFFAKATVTIYPKVQELTLNQVFSASKNTELSDLPFEVIIISGEDNKLIPISGEKKEYSVGATGRVTLYNTSSFQPQKLAIDTRLEGSNGKIYKTKTPVTIPGADQATGLPGAVEVDIYASEPGEAYNSEPLDFKIFGFKGTPKYDTFYGRSLGSITGGLEGSLYTVSAIDRSVASTSLKTSLEDKLLKQLKAQIPDGYLLFDGAITFSMDSENMPEASAEAEAKVSIKGTLAGLLVREEDLVRKIAQVTLTDYQGEPIYIQGLENLEFSFSLQETLFWDSESIDFKLMGPIKIVYQVEASKLVTPLVGKERSIFDTELRKHKNISSADLSIRPFWKNTFPEKLSDIEASVIYPE